MDIEIKIGREVSGTGSILIPEDYKKVGRFHATLLWHNGILTIVDNNSTNGTFVNGRQVAQKKLSTSDYVLLGGRMVEDGAYNLDLSKVYESCRKLEIENRTDYSREFEDIRRAYIEYQEALSNLKKESFKELMKSRILISLIPVTLGILLFFIFQDMSARIIGMSLGGVISSVLLGRLNWGGNSRADNEKADQMASIQIRYQSRYCCPKCGMKYQLSTHWKILYANKKCPNPKCNAVFAKQ